MVKSLTKLFGSKTMKYGTNAIILIAAVAAILVIINILVGMADIKWDLTPNKLYSITDITRDVLRNLDKDVVIYGIFDEGTVEKDYKEVIELLQHYEKYPRVTVKYIDPDKNPGIKKELDPENIIGIEKQDFIVKSGNKVRKLDYYDLFSTHFDERYFREFRLGSTAEQGFTGAIKYVTADRTPVVYFTTGHDEYKIETDYQSVKTYLNRNNYDVKEINLVTAEKVPEDAELVIVGAPKRDFSEDEQEKLKEYGKNGGKIIFMFDSLQSDPQFAQINSLLSNYNLELNYDRVKENDEKRFVPGNPNAVLLDVNKYEIFNEDFNLLLVNSRSVNTLKNVKGYITVTPLLTTSDKAIGEQIDKSRGEDIGGPLDIAVAVKHEGGPKTSKIIVIGNGYFITDEAQLQYGTTHFRNGMYFFLGSLNWAVDKKDDLIVPAKTYDTPRIEINAFQSRIWGLFTIIALPAIILIIGLCIFLRRRHL